MIKEMDPRIVEKAKRVRMIIMDVDGVLTSGLRRERRLCHRDGPSEGVADSPRDGEGVRGRRLAGEGGGDY